MSDAKPPAVAFFESGIPYHVFLGITIPEWAEGACRMVLPNRAELVGDPFRPALHGGLVATLADAAGGLAIYLDKGSDISIRVSTIDLRVDFLDPARIDVPLIADAMVLRVGSRVGVSDIIVHHGDPDEPVAHARGTYGVRRPET